MILTDVRFSREEEEEGDGGTVTLPVARRDEQGRAAPRNAADGQPIKPFSNRFEMTWRNL